MRLLYNINREKCDICRHDVELDDGLNYVSINSRRYEICNDCMWHFREMFGKFQEERRKENEK